MSNQTDPLSDEAFWEWHDKHPLAKCASFTASLLAWQEARRRARAMMEGDLKQNDDLFLENKRLREELEHWKEAAQVGFEANQLLVNRQSQEQETQKARAALELQF